MFSRHFVLALQLSASQRAEGRKPGLCPWPPPASSSLASQAPYVRAPTASVHLATRSWGPHTPWGLIHEPRGGRAHGAAASI
eukprot:scaffold65717_cov34-Tisochrysis_lutea.AAC.1